MTLLILAALALWCMLGLALALLIGGAVRLRDEAGPVGQPRDREAA